MMYGKLFNGVWAWFDADEREHARHLIMDGGVSCDCAARGIPSANGKFRAMPFAGSGEPIYLWPDDVVETSSDRPLDDVLMQWK